VLNPVPEDYRGSRFEFIGEFAGDDLYGRSRGTAHS
jgi:hypothetical protein